MDMTYNASTASSVLYVWKPGVFHIAAEYCRTQWKKK